jgi:hypothetical protein
MSVTSVPMSLIANKRINITSISRIKQREAEDGKGGGGGWDCFGVKNEKRESLGDIVASFVRIEAVAIVSLCRRLSV